MHILFVTLTKLDRNRGDAIHAAELARHLARLGARVTLVGSGVPRFPLEGVTVLDAGPAPRGGPVRRALGFARLVARTFARTLRLGREADVIYTRAVVLGALLALCPRRPFVFEANGLQGDEKRMLSRSLWGRIEGGIVRAAEALCARRARGVVCVTPGIRDILAREYGVPADRLAVANNGVNLDLFTPQTDPQGRQALRTSLGLGDRDAAIVFLGALAPWHDVALLIDAVARLELKGRRPVLLVVGDGPPRKALEEQARTLPDPGRVVFAGDVPYAEAPRYLTLADVCALPLTQERNERIGVSPLKLYSYLACGRFTVASRVGGFDFLEERRLGALAPCGDAAAFAAALKAWLEAGADERRRVEREARRYAEEHGGWDHAARTVLDVCGRAAG